MPHSLRIFLTIVIISVITSIIYGFFLLGSPAQQRLIKLDQQRISDLQNISFAINSYWQNNKKLPENLDLLKKSDLYYLNSLQDPQTKNPYEYRILGEQLYELCANFDAPSVAGDATMPTPVSQEKWDHAAGITCFEREVSGQGIPVPKVMN